MARAWITEVFSSFQGEGIYLGARQIFVRFGGCNLRCSYCDEPDTIPIPSGAAWSAERLKGRIRSLNRSTEHRWVSWTGGEPLLQAGFLRPMMAWARSRGFKNYLETNGTLPKSLAAVADLCDAVAMDIKLPSSMERGIEFWSRHLEFLKVCPEKTFVKVVLTHDSRESEWRQVIRLLQEADPQVPLVLQPATAVPSAQGRPGTGPSGAWVHPLEPSKVLSCFSQAKGLLKSVRIIPQWHPVWQLP